MPEDRIRITFPVWTVVYGNNQSVQMDYEGPIAAFGVFTDQDLADRFARKMNEVTAKSLAIKTPQFMSNFLKRLENEKGYSHVSIDPLYARQSNPTLKTIDEFIAIITQR